jgi:hypothetical protein
MVKTFNPKVVGSIPTRPINEKPAKVLTIPHQHGIEVPKCATGRTRRPDPANCLDMARLDG